MFIGLYFFLLKILMAGTSDYLELVSCPTIRAAELHINPDKPHQRYISVAVDDVIIKENRWGFRPLVIFDGRVYYHHSRDILGEGRVLYKDITPEWFEEVDERISPYDEVVAVPSLAMSG